MGIAQCPGGIIAFLLETVSPNLAAPELFSASIAAGVDGSKCLEVQYMDLPFRQLPLGTRARSQHDTTVYLWRQGCISPAQNMAGDI